MPLRSAWLEADACVKILEERGYLCDTGGASVVSLADIPDGLDAQETKRFCGKEERNSVRRLHERGAVSKGAMRTLQRRIRRIEEQLGSKGKPVLRIVVTAAARRPVLENHVCMKILEECGYLRDAGGVSMVRLIDIPDGLDAKETERFLRERGAELCSPRRDE